MIDFIVRHRVVLSPTVAYSYVEGPGAKKPIAEGDRAFKTMQGFVQKCHEAGASVVVGSHTMLRLEPGGFAFQREMELLVGAGLSPAQVIVAATMEGAKILRAEQRFGSMPDANRPPKSWFRLRRFGESPYVRDEPRPQPARRVLQEIPNSTVSFRFPFSAA